MLWAYFWAAILGGVFLSVVVEQTTGYAPWGWGAVGAVFGIVAVAAFHALFLQLRRVGTLGPAVAASPDPRPASTVPAEDLETEYGTLLHCGDVLIDFKQDGRFSLTAWSRPDLQHMDEVVPVVACFSLWISVLGLAARRESPVLYETLIEDLNRAIEEVIAAPRWENLRVTYIDRLPLANQSVSASASLYVSPDSDLVMLWEYLNTGPEDATTHRRLACTMLEAVIEKLATVQGCQMVTVGCAAITTAVREDPSWLTNVVTEIALLGNISKFALELSDPE